VRVLVASNARQLEFMNPGRDEFRFEFPWLRRHKSLPGKRK
jgi:hypothetical protein